MSSSMPASASSPQPSAVTPSQDACVELRGAGTEELVALMQANGRGRQRGRVLAIVAAVIGVVALGAGGVFAFQELTDSGPQPESVLPSTAVAFLKVDLDPSAGQKVDALRFLRSFPAADRQLGVTSDLRKVAFEAIQDQGRLGKLDYAKDVEPWLGQRLGAGLVPDATTKEGVRPVIALSITDAVVAERHLPALATGLGVQCRVLEAFAVCVGGSTSTALDAVLADAARGSLADSATYRQDMGDLGEDGFVSAWVDSAKMGEVLTKFGAVAGRQMPNLKGVADAGRTSMALRFDGPNLELAGHVNGVAMQRVAKGNARPIAGLPWNTLAAVSVADAGPQFSASWPRARAAMVAALGTKEFARGLAQVEQALGISIPKELAAGLGSQLTVAYGGNEPGKGPKVAVVGDGDADILRTIADHVAAVGAGGKADVTPAGGGTVVSLSDGYAREVATTHGLGEMPPFEGAVKDLDEAQIAVYVDISGLLTQFKDELDPANGPGADAWGNLSALGITARADGSSADFRVRLTTK